MNRKKRDPVRMCAGCKQMKPRSELYRVALTNAGAMIDRECRLGGRGVYVCRNGACVDKISKARKTRTAGHGRISDSVYAELKEMADHE